MIYSLSYITTVLKEVRGTGKRVNTAALLVNELKAVGLIINDTGEASSDGKPFFASRHFIACVYDIASCIAESGVVTLERLQDINAPKLRAMLVESGALTTRTEKKTCKIGGFFPTPTSRKFSPSKKNKFLYQCTSGPDLVWVITKAWATWVETHVPLPKEEWF